MVFFISFVVVVAAGVGVLRCSTVGAGLIIGDSGNGILGGAVLVVGVLVRACCSFRQSILH